MLCQEVDFFRSSWIDTQKEMLCFSPNTDNFGQSPSSWGVVPMTWFFGPLDPGHATSRPYALRSDSALNVDSP